MLAVIDLFTEAEPTWTPEEIAERLGCSRPTGYRYVRELVAAGLLRRAGASRYMLGPRIIELDHQIRATDPVLRAGQPIMEALADTTGCDVLLSNFYGDRVLNVHHVPGLERLNIRFGRGVPMPLFRGSTSKAIIAFLSTAQLKRLYARHGSAIAAAGLGKTWEEFRRAMLAIRRAGYATSSGELDPPNLGIAVPVFAADGEVLGSMSLVTLIKRWDLLDRERIVAMLREAGARISAAIADPGAFAPLPARERRLRQVK
jgi:DNA-binding IclR family transcriptional regulator